MTVLFSRLLYTNCLPGQGIAPGGGFGVQAQSPDTPQALAKAATDTLLYVVPAKWAGNTAMAVGDYPRSLAHFSGGGWATAQGQYAGQEAVGGRSGNHVTDCVLTASAASYGLTRPAQLWGAPFWRDEPFPTSSCPPVEEFLEPGELSVDELARWTRSDTRIAPILKRFVTVLENPEGPRVRIRSVSADLVIRWIAAATLLLPFDDAVNVSFRVYSHNPDYDKHRVLGVHPDTAHAVRVGGGGNAFILDADAFDSDQIEVSRSAELRVDLLSSDADPYDVLDTVGQSASLLAAGVKEVVAFEVARLLCIEGTQLDEPSVREWFDEADAESLAEFGTEVAQKVLDANPSSELILLVDRLQSEGILGLPSAEVRLRLLRAETADVAAGSAVSPERLPDAGLNPDERQAATAHWSSGLALATTVPAFAQLLHVAWRHDLRPEIAPVWPYVARFAKALLSSSSEALAQLDPTRWVFSGEICQTMKGQLAGQLEASGGRSAAELVGKFWQFLLHSELDVSLPIDKAVVGLAMTQGSLQAQAQLLESQLHVASVRSDTYAYLEAANALWPTDDPDPALARRFASGSPRNAFQSASVLSAAGSSIEVDIRDGKLGPEVLAELAHIQSQGYVPNDRAVIRLLKDDEFLSWFVDHVSSLSAQGEVTENAPFLREMAPAILKLRATALGVALVESPYPKAAIDVLKGLPRWAAQPYLDELSRRLASSGSPSLGATVFQVGCSVQAAFSQDKGRDAGSAALELMREYLRSLGTERAVRWAADVESDLASEEWRDEWKTFCAPTSGGKRRKFGLGGTK
jgi:hypothetical protein